MPLYSISTEQKLTFLKPSDFSNERQLQRLVESNLQEIFEARFIATEFVVSVDGVQGGRIDTLALDKENSPIIIEYKKNQSDSIINQGLFYLEWLLTHKGDFEIAVQKKLGKDTSVNWENPRVLVVAERFGQYDVYGVRRMKANVELWKYRYFVNEYLLMENIFSPGNFKVEKPTVISVNKDESTEEVVVKISSYDIDYHLNGKSSQIREVVDSLREKILNLKTEDDDFNEVFRKMYIGYNNGKNFCEFHIYNSHIVIWLDIPHADLKDPKGLCKNVVEKGRWGTGITEFKISQLAEINDAIELVRQSLEYNQ